MTKYDMLFIVDNGITNEDKNAVVEKVVDSIKSLNGVVDTIDKWGTKRFAYPIKKQKEGYYVLIKFSADETVPVEIDRQMKINEKILRQLITKQVSTPMVAREKKVTVSEEVKEVENKETVAAEPVVEATEVVEEVKEETKVEEDKAE